MIFVTVGTHHQPFERLLKALGALSGEDLVVQFGTGSAPPGARHAVPYMPFDEMLDNFRSAEKVITHAGVGSILCASREGHVPLVVPRRADLGEHVDDHQGELTRALAGRGRAIGVWDMADLAGLLADAPPRQSGRETGEPVLATHVREALIGRSPQPSES